MIFHERTSNRIQYRSDLHPKLMLTYRILDHGMLATATVGRVCILERPVSADIDKQGFADAIERAWMRNVARAPEMRDERISVSADRFEPSDVEKEVDTKRNQILAIRLNAREVASIKASAKRLGYRSVSEMLRAKLDEYLRG